MSPITALQLFKNLSDETRLKIVLLLRASGELCVCELCGTLEESQPKISRHLSMLRESGLLIDRREGKWIGTVAKLAMRQPFVLFKGLTFQKLCLPGAFRPGDHHNKMLRPG
ncbi:metalloregulator ArsR/SmtB family transcription factor, partial [Citrobacter freundii]|nr:metalloregulator ArsR/SmtB family transcription factor [Citrobacter freundii]